MSSNGEFSTMSSEEMPSLPKSLPSSREATAEGGSGSSGGYMPLREFLDRFSLPRVVRLEGTGGRPVLLYKQQQRSLRVTASLLMHRYRHDVKVGPEIVIPEGYPGEDSEAHVRFQGLIKTMDDIAQITGHSLTAIRANPGMREGRRFSGQAPVYSNLLGV
ncbi:hypothetical protein G5I_02581 [Acromyrmex echinatior]|uniref:Uncharacterized protein n=1 Tax=Acromyrmex echinatior TaxID=103372 RepID=F4WAP3_ACREC|nr:hypothetical protein G5I_02581 [Acromyrmex echinatior]